MKKKESRKSDRHKRLLEMLNSNPLVTDEELATSLEVSIPTIRLDRLELAIPEVRKRIYAMAEQTMRTKELVGELVDLQPGKEAVSILKTDSSMCLAECDIVRGHLLFAQANSLAGEVIEYPVALTVKSEVRFLSFVRAGSLLKAKATVEEVRGHHFEVKVVIRCDNDDIFEGNFQIRGIDLESADYLKILKNLN